MLIDGQQVEVGGLLGAATPGRRAQGVFSVLLPPPAVLDLSWRPPLQRSAFEAALGGLKKGSERLCVCVCSSVGGRLKGRREIPQLGLKIMQNGGK